MTSEETGKRFTAAKGSGSPVARTHWYRHPFGKDGSTAVLKNYCAPGETQHEIPVEGCVADSC